MGPAADPTVRTVATGEATEVPVVVERARGRAPSRAVVRRRRIVAALSVLAVVAGLTTGVVTDLGVRDRLARNRAALAATQAALAATRADLAGTRGALSGTRADLAGTRHDLEVTRTTLAATSARLAAASASLSGALSQLTATTGQLGATQAQRDALRANLAAAQHTLGAVQTNLSQAEGALFLQGGQINALHDCLNGVTRALNQISVGDQAGAIASIQTAATSCSAAEAVANGGPAPVYPFDFADPFVLRVGSTYYGFATNAAGGNIQMIQSTDLTHWVSLGRDAMAQLPAWAAPNATWAPSVLPVAGGYVLYYSAWDGMSGHHCIGRATSSSPTGPYVDTSTAPLVCRLDLGGALDPSPFVAGDGSSYLVWKVDGPAGATPIWSQQLTADGLALVGQPAQLLIADRAWQRGVVEGPNLVALGGVLHLLYSGNDWNTDAYGIGDAVCQTPLGPCADSSGGPILASRPGVLGPGGPSTFTDAAGQSWLAYHAWVGGATGYPNSRKLFLARISVSGGAITVGS